MRVNKSPGSGRCATYTRPGLGHLDSAWKTASSYCLYLMGSCSKVWYVMLCKLSISGWQTVDSIMIPGCLHETYL